MAFEITTLTAFVAIDENGEEGVMGFHTGEGWMPLVCADEKRVASLFPMAELIKAKSGKEYRVKKFQSWIDVTDEVKKKYG